MKSLPLSFKRLLLASVASAGLVFAPAAPTLAAPARAANAQITGFDMEPVAQLAPGAELFFRVTGTAGAQASVRVAGVARTIVLQEVDTGTYEGSYTIRPNDRVSQNSSATVNLRYRGRAATSTLGRLAVNAPPAAQPAQPAQPQQARPAAPFGVNRFVATPIDKIEPGAELRFLVEGSPGARASFTIENVVANVPMREAAPGRYEGSYTIKRLDRINAGVPVVATLEGNGQVVRANLAGSMLVDIKPPVIKNVAPRDGEAVTAGGPITVSGTFDNQGGAGVDPKSVRIVVGGRDVTANASITPEFFTYRADLPPGNYAADVTAKDPAGNTARSVWSFSVRPAVAATAAAPAQLPLEITSHAPNASVGAGRVEVRGRTAPGATVDVQVIGVASVAGMFGVNQPLYSERLTADNAGNFVFGFAPPLRVPGMRYEVDVKSVSGTQSRDTKLVLFQQR